MTKVKDHDYAWIIVGAGAGLMLSSGYSTYSTSGLLFENVDIEISYHIWLINTMYNIWNLSGAFAGPLSTVFTYRKIAMLGCFSAALGFLMAASTLHHHSWLFLAFAGFVGTGLGLAVHITFLLVMLNFDKYQGMANGVLQLGAGIGYFIAPYVYNVMPGQEDRFHVKALVTVLAFLAAILFIPLETWQTLSRNKSVKPNSEINGMERRDSSNRDCREEIPLMEVENKTWEENFGKPKKRGHCHYLQAVSASILPNIPEESEGPSPATGTCTPLSSTSLNNLAGLKSNTDQIIIESKHTEINLNESEPKRNENAQRNSASFEEIGEANMLDCSDKIDRLHSNHFKEKIQKSVTNDEKVEKVKNAGTGELFGKRPSRTKSKPPVPFRDKVSKAFKSVDIRYFKNVEFLIMALGGSLALVSSPTVPIALYGYLYSLHAMDYKGEGETALLIIFSVDVVSRLFISFASDFSWLNRRTTFFVGSLCGSGVIAGLGFTKDTQVIYLLCASYGVCHGTLFATESIIFCDAFGISALSTTYGLFNCIKVLVNITITLLLRSPTVAYTYAIHPLTLSSNAKYFEKNATSTVSDPLGLFVENDETQLQNTSFTLLFLLLSAPGLFGALIWTAEDVWLRIRKSSTALTSQRFSNDSNGSHRNVVKNSTSIEV